ncbi:MAG: hypothetical protein ACJ749_11140 [Flavisolibacter sp.]
MGLIRKIKVLTGSTTVVELPTRILEKMEDTIDMQDGLVEADVVQRELGISKKTLTNYISDGTIQRHMYIQAVNGRRKYFIYLILGWVDKHLPWKKYKKWSRA